jgi:hypothetical protein
MELETIGVWRSLVARVVRDDEVAGSNPVTPTKNSLMYRRAFSFAMIVA